MYNPTEKEKELCRDIVKELLDIDEETKYDEIIDEIFKITYSIGGDYGEDTLRKVASIVIVGWK